MVKIHELRPAAGSRKSSKRLGRGTGSGIGKTSGRGHKGQRSRSGGRKSVGFEGGQTPLHRRVPKLPGFKNRFKKIYAQVNTGRLNEFESGGVVGPENLVEKGMVRKGNPVKVLATGDLDKKLTVKAHAFSKEAAKKIEKAGGTVEVI